MVYLCVCVDKVITLVALPFKMVDVVLPCTPRVASPAAKVWFARHGQALRKPSMESGSPTLDPIGWLHFQDWMQPTMGSSELACLLQAVVRGWIHPFNPSWKSPPSKGSNMNGKLPIDQGSGENSWLSVYVGWIHALTVPKIHKQPTRTHTHTCSGVNRGVMQLRWLVRNRMISRYP